MGLKRIISAIIGKEKETPKEIPGIYDVPETKEYSRSEEWRKTGYIFARIKAKPRLEDFFSVSNFDLEAKEGEFKEEIRTENPTYYYNPKLEILLYASGNPECGNESFTVFGRIKPVLKYLQKNYQKEHIRLNGYLKKGIDTEWIKKILGSPAYIKAYEEISGIKLEEKRR